ncbi:MAG: acyl-CoA synthetase FdrA [Anaerolineaceae bacterium]|nr:acyl-CoA synthetase FdrA [Anaerolineaceae bacterium]
MKLINKTVLKRNEYFDSITLMVISREISRLPGVDDASVVMGTEANKRLLDQAGLLSDEARRGTANDLIISFRAEESNAEKILVDINRLFQRKRGAGAAKDTYQPKTLRAAVKSCPSSNIVVISVAGRYAAEEAQEALQRGLHVMLFSDNVSINDELSLKTYARKNGLLLMGPGAGTAIINGAALGFANALPRGPVGIVAAAGTGLQEVSTILARHGIGITQGIGTGGRDLSQEIGGIMMLEGLKALQEDNTTEIIALISKPPALVVAQKILNQVARSAKPTVICFLGAGSIGGEETAHIYHVQTLQECALRCAKLAGTSFADLDQHQEIEANRLSNLATNLVRELQPEQRFLRGLYSGGTLCYEAQWILSRMLREPIYSNVPLSKSNKMTDSMVSRDHCVIDLGEEEFTVGRPHPMIDNDLRIRRIQQEARDRDVAAIILDIVIGYGAHPDPGGELAAAIYKAKQIAQKEGRELVFIGSVTGTEADPQGLSHQVRTLESTGMVVCQSNAAAAKLAGMIVSIK